MISQLRRQLRLLLATSLAVGSAACSWDPAVTNAENANPSVVPTTARPVPVSVGERAASVALQQIGVPYRYGGSSPRGFDCSGLVQYAYTHAGVAVPRTTSDLWSTMAPVGRQNLRVGDVLFFNIEGKMSHVGLYVGNDRFVHAPSSGRVVSLEDLESSFYRQALIRAGRPR